jgi:hypothetical protein
MAIGAAGEVLRRLIIGGVPAPEERWHDLVDEISFEV